MHAHLNPPEKLKAAIELAHVERPKIGSVPGAIALAWLIKPDGKTYWHNGGTGGYTSYISFNAPWKTGVVVLVNGAGTLMNLIGDRVEKLLGGEIMGPLPLHRPVTVESKTLDEYVGAFELAPGSRFTVTREGDQLLGQIAGQRPVRMYPEAKDQFFTRVVDAVGQLRSQRSGKSDRAGVASERPRDNGQEGAVKSVAYN